jgi:hypothetical protein
VEVIQKDKRGKERKRERERKTRKNLKKSLLDPFLLIVVEVILGPNLIGISLILHAMFGSRVFPGGLESCDHIP